jgi:NAD(P)H-dependent flavin oxidoreductase YrpB (nitropropane dioxygenase family)
MHTQLCDLFGIDVPIFAFSHCRDVVAAVTNAGGLGVLGALAFSPEQLEVELLWIDENVDGKPYGVDTVMPMKYEGKDRGLGQADEKSGEVDAKVFQDLVPEPVTSWIESVLEEYEVPPLPEGFEHDAGVGGGGTGLLGWTEGGGRNHVDIALQHPGVKLLVNALGPPPKDIIDLAHDHGIKVAALTGAVEHAIRQQQQGVPDIVDAVSPTPVLGAGGIASGRQAAAAMALGAQGIWTGSVWLGVRESDASPLVKEKLFHARPRDAVRSRSLSGKPARLLRTAWTDAWERNDCPGTLPMPLQYMACAEAQTRIMLAARKQDAKARELVGMPVGQVVGRMTEEKATAEVMYEFIDEFVQTVDRLQGMLDAAQKL